MIHLSNMEWYVIFTAVLLGGTAVGFFWGMKKGIEWGRKEQQAAGEAQQKAGERLHELKQSIEKRCEERCPVTGRYPCENCRGAGFTEHDETCAFCSGSGFAKGKHR